jgi:prolyl-tRNA synthetase
MRMSSLFGTTLREAPAAAPSEGEALLARAGYLRQAGTSGTCWLPLGCRSLGRLTGLLRSEAAAAGGAEMILPAGEGMRALASLCRSEVRSWRMLPRLLLCVPDPAVLDCCLLDADDAALKRQCLSVLAMIRRVLGECGLPAADLGGAGGTRSIAHLAAGGDRLVLRCTACGSSAWREMARFPRPASPVEQALPLEKVPTPDCTTIEDLCRLLGVDRSRTAKAVFQVADEERFVFAVVRGDRDLGEEKLRLLLGAEVLRPASAKEIQAAGAVPGYASPIGLPSSTLVVVDEGLPASANLVAGANQEGFHLLNTNIPRDYRPTMIADIAMIPDGSVCAECGGSLETVSGFEIASFLGRTAGVYQDREGREAPLHLGRVRFHAGRALACAAALHRDAHGLCLPAAISPFDVHVVSLGGAGTEALAGAEGLARDLEAAGVAVLLDDREESACVKFADADLIGAPLRITASARSLKAGGFELKARTSEEKTVVPTDQAVARSRRQAR